MSSFYRSNLYGNSEDHDEGIDGYDMSGFLGDTPPIDEFSEASAEKVQPKVTQRPRGGGGSSNASGTVGYIIPQPFQEDTTEPTWKHKISPFWADDNGLAPRAAAITKSAGVTTMVLAGTYALAKKSAGGSPLAEAATITGFGMYLHPTIGVNHGALPDWGKDHWIGKYPRYVGIGIIHSLGAYGFTRLIRPRVMNI